jgi:hypothetical protein
VARATTASPSNREWAGWIARANPVCPLCASRWQPVLSSRASVTSTARVVFSRPNPAAGAVTGTPAKTGRPSGARTSPHALTTASTATVAGPAVPVATPTSPGSRLPRHLPVPAPVPAPAAPVPSGSPASAASAAARPAAASGGAVRTDPSKMDIPTTIGTGPAGVGNPVPRSRSSVMTPSAADSPYADPPDSTTASTRSTNRAGSSSANSRVAGAPPRTSPDATVPGGGRITVTPVSAPVQCPAHAGPSCGRISRPYRLDSGGRLGLALRLAGPPPRR